MTVQIGKLHRFGAINIGTTVHTDAGDIITAKFRNSFVSSSIYVRSHLVIAGLFRIDFSDSDYTPLSRTVGEIFPSNNDTPRVLNTVSLTSQVPNSSYHCIVPSHGYRVSHEIIDVTQNLPFYLELGSLYVPMMEFNMDSKNNESGTVISCINQSANITPLHNGRLFKFTAVKIDTVSPVVDLNVV